MNTVTKILLVGTLAAGVVSASPLVLNEVEALESHLNVSGQVSLYPELIAQIEDIRVAADENLLTDANTASQLRYQQLLKRLNNASRYLSSGVADAAKQEIAIADQILSLPPHNGFPGILSS